MTKVSISVPVYNVEKYLPQCLDSLLNQTLKEIEIILVDDGSLDSSGAICDEYAQKDSRIKVIHKENGGLASARQAAFNCAAGEYFCACDSDDWTEPNMYELLYNKAVNSGFDIVACNYYRNYQDGRQEEIILSDKYKKLDRETVLENTLHRRFPHMVWNKIYKKEFLDRHKIGWEPGINQGEDYLFFLKVLQHPVTIDYVPKALYHNRRRLGEVSYTNNITLSTYNQMYKIREWIMENYQMDNYPGAMFHLWVNLAFAGLRVKEGMPDAHYNETALEMIKLSEFFKYRQFSLKDCLIFLTKLFGYKCGRFIVKQFYNKFYK